MGPLEIFNLASAGLGAVSTFSNMAHSQASYAREQQWRYEDLARQDAYNTLERQRQDTAYRRAAYDMKAAGLNPSMMFGHGQAEQTSGATAPTQTHTGGYQQVVPPTAVMDYSLRKEQNDINRIFAEAEKTKADAAKSQAGISKDIATQTILESQARVGEINARAGQLVKETDLLIQKIRSAKIGAELDELLKITNISNAYSEQERKYWEAEIATKNYNKVNEEIERLKEEIRKTAAEADSIPQHLQNEKLATAAKIAEAVGRVAWLISKLLGR